LRIFNTIFDFESSKNTVVTIGTFDGVHKGHRHILKKVTAIAESKKLGSTVLTFFPHPRMVLQPGSNLKLINTIEERELLLAQSSIENLIIHPFSVEFSRTAAHEYVKNILVDQLKAKVVVIGYDHRFGRNRSASIEQLNEYAAAYDFEVIEISKEEVEEVAVSSTKVRDAITDGNMMTATKYLEQPYFLTGAVVSGKKIGRTLGYPTANLQLKESYKLVPKNGVYITSSVINGNVVHGITNIGTNPTVQSAGEQTIETYYLDFNKDLYGEQLVLQFHKRLRSEQKFDTMDQLVQAMNGDAQNARNYVNDLG
jgi:riboflavin kinase/FMN adenylyltransferase